MKKIPFYNPASPSLFHISIVLLCILTFLLLLVFHVLNPFSFIYLFSALYPFFILVMLSIIRRDYFDTYQSPVLEKIVNQLVRDNRILISVIYIPFIIFFIFGLGFVAMSVAPQSIIAFLLFFCFFPIIIRLILLRKINFIRGVIIIILPSVLILILSLLSLSLVVK